MVPERLKLITFAEKLNSIQEITVMNNYVVLPFGAAAQKGRQAELSSSIC